MRRNYHQWDAEAVKASIPLDDNTCQLLVSTLAGGGSVVVADQVLMKLWTDEFFITKANPKGRHVHAVFRGGEVAAAGENDTPAELLSAVLWAQHVASGGEP